MQSQDIDSIKTIFQSRLTTLEHLLKIEVNKLARPRMNAILESYVKAQQKWSKNNLHNSTNTKLG